MATITASRTNSPSAASIYRSRPNACSSKKPPARFPTAAAAPRRRAIRCTTRSSVGSKAGAPADAGKVPTIDALEIYPPGALLDGAGETQQLTVRAKYSDGTDRDVTGLAVFLSSNDNAAAVYERGQGHGRQSRRGLHHGPLRKENRRRAVHRAAEEACVPVERRAGQQLHRRAGRRQAHAGCAFSRPSSAPMPNLFAA